MLQFWLRFMNILMMNVHSLRTQNWVEFKSTLCLMLPWLQNYDHDTYGKWILQFWLEISSLTQEQEEYMSQGLFSTSMTGKPYSCEPLDLWIEMTMNKGSKMNLGWVNILKNEKLLLTSS